MARDQCNHVGEYPDKSCAAGSSIKRLRVIRGEERTNIPQQVWSCELREHPLLCFRPGDGLTLLIEISDKEFHNPIEIGKRMKCMVEIEKIAPLIVLQQGAQLRRQKFFRGKGRYGRIAREPRVFDSVWYRNRWIERFDLRDVDLGLQPELRFGIILGRHTKA